MAFTAALDSTYATDAQLLPILQATQSLELLSGSLIGITNGLMAFTAALDSTYATDAQLLPILQATASLNTFSGSLLNEIASIEAYTASLKGAAIVSSSQQITNYYKFAETASANTFYGNQTITGSFNVTGSVNIDNVIKLTPVETFPSGQAGMLVASASYGKTNLYVYDGSDWKWLVTGSIA